MSRFFDDRKQYAKNYVKAFKSDFYDVYDEVSEKIVKEIEARHSAEEIISFRKFVILSLKERGVKRIEKRNENFVFQVMNRLRKTQLTPFFDLSKEQYREVLKKICCCE